MASHERRATAWLTMVFFLRMLGLFMILPVLTLHADKLTGATPLLAGLALSAYGLTQALLQIPAGNLSDRIGRRRVIVGGLCCFVVGSIVAAMSTSILMLIIGRLLQGAGAVAAALMALAADIISEQQRTKAMAAFGVSIGGAFIVGIVGGPVVYGLVGLSGVFWSAACLGLLAIAIVIGPVPQPPAAVAERDIRPQTARIREALGVRGLTRAYAGIFLLHLILMASFVALPLMLRDSARLAGAQHWQVYLPAFLLAISLMVPYLKRTHQPEFVRRLLLGAVALLAVTQLSLSAVTATPVTICAHLVAFFTCFNLIEALLPSLVSRIAPVAARGTALGVFSSCQFLGAFCGGVVGGWALGTFGLSSIFLTNGIAALLWLGFAATERSTRC